MVSWYAYVWLRLISNRHGVYKVRKVLVGCPACIRTVEQPAKVYTAIL